MHSEKRNSGQHRGRMFSSRWFMVIAGCSLGLVTLTSVSMSGGNIAQPLPKPTTERMDCTSSLCHPDRLEHKVVHVPVAQNKCLDCHEYVDAPQHLLQLKTPKNQLCVTCHEIDHKDYTHKPVVDGNCVGCHDPHGSEYPMMMVADPTRGLCVSCHEQDFATKEYIHGPVAVGACIVCHEAHSSYEPKLLNTPVEKICGNCHSDVVPEKKPGRNIHAPIEQGCHTCHDPHASNNRFQLSEKVPELCYGCHDTMAEEFANAHIQHSAAVENGGCVNCHTPHYSELPRLQKEAQPDICLSCHNKEIQATDGHMLTNMAKLLDENPNHHGPIREGGCTACHSPHASDFTRLLAAAYPPEFYAKFSLERYDLCFGCHMSELVTGESGIGVTKFRNGKNNLHYLHVNQEKGRTCRACHEVHASQRPFHIRESVPFGQKGWPLEIRYEKSENGGSCSPGCHKAKSYDRTTT